jgi:hypothetical protein
VPGGHVQNQVYAIERAPDVRSFSNVHETTDTELEFLPASA